VPSRIQCSTLPVRLYSWRGASRSGVQTEWTRDTPPAMTSAAVERARSASRGPATLATTLIGGETQPRASGPRSTARVVLRSAGCGRLGQRAAGMASSLSRVGVGPHIRSHGSWRTESRSPRACSDATTAITHPASTPRTSLWAPRLTTCTTRCPRVGCRGPSVSIAAGGGSIRSRARMSTPARTVDSAGSAGTRLRALGMLRDVDD